MSKILLLGVLLLMGSVIQAQPSVEPPDSSPRIYSHPELDLLLGPIALYPDLLLAALLPAATQPAELVMAVRFLNYGGNIDQIEIQPWSDSVKALAHYPDVIRWLDENLEWTTEVGEAFQQQPEDVIDTIQRLRAIAKQLGHLITTPEQKVEYDETLIDILPPSSESFYLPVYDPDYIFTRPAAAGVGPRVRFGPSRPLGAWLRSDWDWSNRRVVTWSAEQPRTKAWWTQPRTERFPKGGQFKEWCPRVRPGQAKFWQARRSQSAPAFRQGNVQRGGSSSDVAKAGHSGARIAK